MIGAPEEMVEALLIATALPALMWLDGAFVLHAAAVVPAGQHGALAIVGASGSGKSWLAAAMTAGGAIFVADDSIAVRWSGDRPICAGLAGGYHLSRSEEKERTFHMLAHDRTGRAAPLTGVVVLGHDPGTERLGAVEAVGALLANRHRASVPRRCGLEPRALADAARLAQAVPVYRWSCDRADALLDDTVRRAIMPDGEE